MCMLKAELYPEFYHWVVSSLNAMLCTHCWIIPEKTNHVCGNWSGQCEFRPTHELPELSLMAKICNGHLNIPKENHFSQIPSFTLTHFWTAKDWDKRWYVVTDQTACLEDKQLTRLQINRHWCISTAHLHHEIKLSLRRRHNTCPSWNRLLERKLLTTAAASRHLPWMVQTRTELDAGINGIRHSPCLTPASYTPVNMTYHQCQQHDLMYVHQNMT